MSLENVINFVTLLKINFRNQPLTDILKSKVSNKNLFVKKIEISAVYDVGDIYLQKIVNFINYFLFFFLF